MNEGADFGDDYDLLISADEYRDLVNLIYTWSGINLGDSKQELLKARLTKRIRHYRFASFREYYNYVVNEPQGEEVVQLLDAVSTNVTSFFREDKHFRFMTGIVLPDVIARKNKSGDRRLRVWSAACATGEEVYTILMALKESLDDPYIWDIKVLGTDISTKALGLAKAGLYDTDKVKGVSRVLLEKYFQEQTRDGRKVYQVKPELMESAIFARLNLMDRVFPFRHKLDIVFCRNAMIYFDRETQREVVKRIYNYLDEGGYFFTGHSESLMGIDVDFQTVAPAVYKKR